MIPLKKVEAEILKVKQRCVVCKEKHRPECYNCLRWVGFIKQMATAEIPVDYWHRNMKGFHGYEEFKKTILEFISKIDEEYDNGSTLFLVGERGRGKTMAANEILKKAILKGYSAYYTTLSDFVTRSTTSQPLLKTYVKEMDFLVVDEIDNRFFPTQSSMELYGAQLENVLRGRMQNKLPTIMCSNNTRIELIFGGEFKRSFQSLWSQFVKTIIAVGPDARKGEEKLNG
jgi:DNA replication protein DnaC